MAVADASAEPSWRLPIIGNIRIKYIALLLLVCQTVGAIITLRISRMETDALGNKYLNTTAVFMAELLKLVGSCLLVWSESNYSVSTTLREINSQIIMQPIETFKVGIPAFLYTVQNNLIFIALSNMSAALYQVTYQLKILTTALLSVIILRRSLSTSKWLSLFILTAGVAFVQIPSESSDLKNGLTPKIHEGSFLIGLAAVLSACLTSGFAGVYFEKILKNSPISIWMRNIQLAIYGSILGLIAVYWNDGDSIKLRGFFQGYSKTTCLAILFQGAGGLIVAAVLKYADNILKCFGNALAIVFSCILSYLLMKDFVFSSFFFVGTVLVIFSTYSYGVDLDLAKHFRLFYKDGGYKAIEGVEVAEQQC